MQLYRAKANLVVNSRMIKHGQTFRSDARPGKFWERIPEEAPVAAEVTASAPAPVVEVVAVKAAPAVEVTAEKPKRVRTRKPSAARKK